MRILILEGTQLGWEQQPTFYQRMGKLSSECRWNQSFPTPPTQIHRGKTIGLCLWATPLYKVFNRCGFL